MSGHAEEEPAHPREQEEAELFRRAAALAGVVAATEDKIAATLEQVARHRSPPEAARLRAMAEDARDYAAQERGRAASYRMLSGEDGQAGKAGREPGPPEARSADNEPGSRESRRDQIRLRLDAIRMRVDELQEKRQGDASRGVSSERFVLAQHHAAISQAAAEQATGASARASRRTADSHVRAALLHERAAAAGFGDTDEHERQAAIHRAAAMVDTQRADDAQNAAAVTAGQMMLTDQARTSGMSPPGAAQPVTPPRG
jgi:hypothetical protein